MMWSPGLGSPEPAHGVGLTTAPVHRPCPLCALAASVGAGLASKLLLLTNWKGRSLFLQAVLPEQGAYYMQGVYVKKYHIMSPALIYLFTQIILLTSMQPFV